MCDVWVSFAHPRALFSHNNLCDAVDCIVCAGSMQWKLYGDVVCVYGVAGAWLWWLLAISSLPVLQEQGSTHLVHEAYVLHKVAH